MDHRTLGCTSLTVSELCLGTMHFGWSTDEPTSLAILDAYHRAGGNFIQGLSLCAATPGSRSLTEFSETVVGQWSRSRGIRRDELVLATQVNPSNTADLGAATVAKRIREGCEASLERLRTDYLDVLVCRWPDRGDLVELRRALNAIVRAGIARYVILAKMPAWRVVATLAESYRDCDVRIAGLQADYSLLARTSFEPELARVCEEYRLGFLARSPLAGGVLGGGIGLRRSRRRWLAMRFGVDCRSRIAAAAGAIAHARGASPAQIALAWVLRNRRVTSALVGVNSVAHLDELIDATRFALTCHELEHLHSASCVQQLVVPSRHAVTAPVAFAAADASEATLPSPDGQPGADGRAVERDESTIPLGA